MAALVVARCDGSEVLESIDGTLDDVTSFIDVGIKARRRTASITFAQPVLLGVTPLGANTAHAALLDLVSVMAHTVGPVHAQASRTLARTTFARTGNANGIEHRSDLSRVAALSGSDDKRQWQAMPIDAQMDFAGDAAP